MIVVVLLTAAAGAVLLWALYTEQVPPPRSPVRGPRWVGLPGPADILRRDFPLAIGGYDPRAVDAHLRAVSDAFVAVRGRLASGDAVPTDPDAASAQAGVASDPRLTPAAGSANVSQSAEAMEDAASDRRLSPAAGGWPPPPPTTPTPPQDPDLPAGGRHDRPDGQDGAPGSVADE